MIVTRFAPSPTGLLHLGHAYSALTAWDLARKGGGVCLLRFEDIDTGRSRPEFEATIIEDLVWLGLAWPEPVMRQSARVQGHAAALDQLRDNGLVYPCTCTRRDIAAALSAPQEGAEWTGPIYPGTCRGRRHAPGAAAWRLDMDAAIARLGGDDMLSRLDWHETCEAPGRHRLDAGELRAAVGDVVLGRRDSGTSYHLAVVLDDAAQGVDLVVRGVDLIEVTPLHRLLQALLDLPVPRWHHHRLIRDETGRRLAKRDAARSLATLRAAGHMPADIRAMVALSPAAATG